MVRDSSVYYWLGTSQVPVHETQTGELHEVTDLYGLTLIPVCQCQPSESRREHELAELWE